MLFCAFSMFCFSFQVTLKSSMMMWQSKWSLQSFKSWDSSILFATLLCMLSWTRTSRKIFYLPFASALSKKMHHQQGKLGTQGLLWGGKRQVILREFPLTRMRLGERHSVMATLKWSSVINRLQKEIWKGTSLYSALSFLCILQAYSSITKALRME